MFNRVHKLKIKNAVSEILATTTVHAIPNIYRSKRVFIKLFWTLCLLASIGASSYFTTITLIRFFEYGTNTEIETYNEEESQFPTVSICSVSSLNASSLIHLEFNTDAKISVDNSSYYLEEFIDPIYKKCFRFNSGKNMLNKSTAILSSSLAGKINGFRIKLKVKINDFSNLYVLIHNYTENPITLLHKAFSITSGTYNHFAVEKTFNKRLGSPYSSCLKDISQFKLNKTIVNFFIETNRSYLQKDCMPLCRNLLTFEKFTCGCNSTFVTADIDCYFKIKDDLDQKSEQGQCLKKLANELQFNYKTCLNYCPLECDSITYSISSSVETITISGNISQNYKHDFINFTNYEDVKSSFFSISVYYPDLKYTLITQNPKFEDFDLASNIGGILGLFIGVSFLSFIEIFELFFEILFLLFESI